VVVYLDDDRSGEATEMQCMSTERAGVPLSGIVSLTLGELLNDPSTLSRRPITPSTVLACSVC